MQRIQSKHVLSWAQNSARDTINLNRTLFVTCLVVWLQWKEHAQLSPGFIAQEWLATESESWNGMQPRKVSTG